MTCFDRNERRQWSFELCCLRFTLPSVSENTDKRSALVYYAQWCLDHEDCECVEHTEDNISCIQYLVFVLLLGGSDSPREIRGHARALLGESVYFLFWNDRDEIGWNQLRLQINLIGDFNETDWSHFVDFNSPWRFRSSVDSSSYSGYGGGSGGGYGGSGSYGGSSNYGGGGGGNYGGYLSCFHMFVRVVFLTHSKLPYCANRVWSVSCCHEQGVVAATVAVEVEVAAMVVEAVAIQGLCLRSFCKWSIGQSPERRELIAKGRLWWKAVHSLAGKKSTINKFSPGMFFLLRFHLEGMTHMSATRSLKKHVEGMTIETEMSWGPSADKRFLSTCLHRRVNPANLFKKSNAFKIRITMHLLSLLLAVFGDWYGLLVVFQCFLSVSLGETDMIGTMMTEIVVVWCTVALNRNVSSLDDQFFSNQSTLDWKAYNEVSEIPQNELLSDVRSRRWLWRSSPPRWPRSRW